MASSSESGLHRRRSLAWKVGLRLGLACALLFAGLITLSAWTDYRALRSARLRQIEATVDTLAPPLGVAVWNVDTAAIKAMARQFMVDPSIVAVEVRDEAGSVIASEARAATPNDVERWKPVPLTEPRSHRRVGELDVRITLRPVVEATQDALRQDLVLDLARLLVILAVLATVFNRVVLRRLAGLSAQVNRLGTDATSWGKPFTGDADGAEDEIGVLAAEIGRLLERERELVDTQARRVIAESANRAKTQLLSRVSHELRTPLNAVMGFGQLLDRSPHVQESADRQNLQRLLSAGWHLSAIIDDLLDLARAEAGKMKLQIEVVDLVGAVHEAVDYIREAQPAASMPIEIVAPGRRMPVKADELRLRQVLINLLSNAVKYGSPQGPVVVAIDDVPAGGVQVCVRDSGVGMTPAQLSRLFEPFNRLGKERTEISGSGLGLVISKALVEQMGGRLSVDSVHGRGSSFTVELLRSEEQPPTAPEPPGPQAVQPSEEARTLLYVEDDEVNVELVRSMLALRPRIAVHVEQTIAGGLQWLQHHVADLVLLDMHLSDGTGVDFLHALRARGPAVRPNVIMLSGDCSEDIVDECLGLGAVGFLKKPLKFETALKQIDLFVGAARQPPAVRV